MRPAHPPAGCQQSAGNRFRFRTVLLWQDELDAWKAEEQTSLCLNLPEERPLLVLVLSLSPCPLLVRSSPCPRPLFIFSSSSPCLLALSLSSPCLLALSSSSLHLLLVLSSFSPHPLIALFSSSPHLLLVFFSSSPPRLSSRASLPFLARNVACRRGEREYLLCCLLSRC